MREVVIPTTATQGVEIAWTTTSQDGERIYQKMKLTNVLASSFASGGQADDKPVQQISFNPFVQSYDPSKD
ncbi:MAG: hypothetical protein KF889_29060 [Alphaproteobacteria bacterium]|nr:hypothetical protein [Alphaproteobacteria bacterium]MCW5742443.1 hypothetical protein [Alphaproteobacteria bacterium]